MNADKYQKSRTLMTSQMEAGSGIIVTGACGGIGSGIVKRLIADGWHVVAVDLHDDGLKTLQSEISNPERLQRLAVDVSVPEMVESAATEIEGRGVRIVGLVNAAGILQDVVPFMSLDLDQQRKIWDVNYFGAFYCTRFFGRQIIGNGGGAIVNITSINEARILPLHAYGPTKVALGSLTTLTAGEFGAHAVRVNTVAPGFTLTPIMREKIASGKRDVRALEQATAMGRLIEIEEVASVVSFLLSDESSAVTGVSIAVDAGWLTTSHWMNFADVLRADTARA